MPRSPAAPRTGGALRRAMARLSRPAPGSTVPPPHSEPSAYWYDLVDPERADAVRDALYGLLLGRLVDPAGLGFADLIRRGRFHQAVREIVDSAEFREPALVCELTADCVEGGVPFAPTSPFGRGMSERVVEVPWVISRYRGEASVLEIGYANTTWAYMAFLLRLPTQALHGVDMSRRTLRGVVPTQADARGLPYRDGAFDLVLLVSTIEHIGFDNRHYRAGGASHPGDESTLAEVARVLRPGGRALVTVPVGRREEHSWFQQYSVSSWERLVSRVPFDVEEQATFRVDDTGWQPEDDRNRLDDIRYGDGRAAAGAVLCTALVRR